MTILLAHHECIEVPDKYLAFIVQYSSLAPLSALLSSVLKSLNAPGQFLSPSALEARNFSYSFSFNIPQFGCQVVFRAASPSLNPIPLISQFTVWRTSLCSFSVFQFRFQFFAAFPAQEVLPIEPPKKKEQQTTLAEQIRGEQDSRGPQSRPHLPLIS